MKYCDLTLPTPAENLACDEALLDLCEAERGREVLRLWEPAGFFVVLGYANRAATEANLEWCRRRAIPVLRRCSGGGTVLQGPGCLNYSLVLRFDETSPLRSITATNEFILQRHRQALAALLGAPIERQGHTDLAIGGLKFCGNSQRRRQHALLFHGCLLLDLDISLVQQALPLPSRQPDYRRQRPHTDFLMNLKTPAHHLKAALRQAWNADEPAIEFPIDMVQALARQKYSRDEWNFKF